MQGCRAVIVTQAWGSGSQAGALCARSLVLQQSALQGQPCSAILPSWVQEDPSSAGELVLSDLEDGFHRLIAHGLAEFHGLSSHSRPVPGGGKVVVLRRRASAASSAALGPSAAAAFGGSPSAVEGGASGGSPAAAAVLGAEEREDEGGEGSGEAPAPGMPLPICCSDILHILEDEKQPLCPAVLSQAYLHPLDSSSEAGDLHHAADQLQAHHHAAAVPLPAAAAPVESPPHVVLAA